MMVHFICFVNKKEEFRILNSDMFRSCKDKTTLSTNIKHYREDVILKTSLNLKNKPVQINYIILLLTAVFSLLT